MRLLRKQMLHSLKLIVRQPDDQGITRMKATPDSDIMEQNVINFLQQWEHVELEEQQVLPEPTCNAIARLLVHIKAGCLSNIPVSGGTNRNESLHRLLNKSIGKARIGIQLAVACLGKFFYRWNEKRLRNTTSKVTSPIEIYRGIICPTENHEIFGTKFNKPSSTREDFTDLGTVGKLLEVVEVEEYNESDSDDESSDQEVSNSDDIAVDISERLAVEIASKATKQVLSTQLTSMEIHNCLTIVFIHRCQQHYSFFQLV